MPFIENVELLFLFLRADPKAVYFYRLTENGLKAALLMVQLRRLIYGPLAFGFIRHRPNKFFAPDSKFERAYYKIEESVDKLVQLMAA